MHSQSVGNGRVNIDGFFGDTATFVDAQNIKSAHVVQAVGQLHQNYPDVFGHGHGHFLKVFGLYFGLRIEIKLVEFADPVHQVGHGFTKLAGNGIASQTSIFNYIVQHGGHQALMVQVHFNQNVGNCKRMGNIVFAAVTVLAVVGLLSVVISAPDQINLGRLKISL